MNSKLILALFALGGMAVACNALSPDQVANATAILDQSLAEGTLSPSEHSAAVAALTEGDWGEVKQIGAQLLETGIAVGLAMLGVRQWRGSTLKRKGAPPAA